MSIDLEIRKNAVADEDILNYCAECECRGSGDFIDAGGHAVYSEEFCTGMEIALNDLSDEERIRKARECYLDEFGESQ